MREEDKKKLTPVFVLGFVVLFVFLYGLPLLLIHWGYFWIGLATLVGVIWLQVEVFFSHRTG